MYGKRYGSTQNQSFRIQRMNEKELDEAIEELEKRGYECLKRGTASEERKYFNYKDNYGTKLKYVESETQVKCWANMKRLTPYVRGESVKYDNAKN